MDKILSKEEAEKALKHLSENDREEVKRDIIRFGEYYLGMSKGKLYRLSPLNIVIIDGKPQLIKPDPVTEI